ncbi:hypothetical protein BDV95DRAFT_504514 [Massariosphaeria phaeospora]|uniref:Uncharacterized protein n=1 Tax=Massariosphaeria phaeospora TaxID=100035 RepID=A0A7C8I1H5_9PLEO|nr:hypothetical protein BDV95DRAFT_504514 [Massariosphaeria phaeospora]
MSPTPAPVPAGLPSPRSPTLSDFGMILPESTFPRSRSPSPYVERPPSPPALYTHANHSTRSIKLASAPQGRRGASPACSPPLSKKSSRSTLRTMADINVGAKYSALREDALASSPTIQDSLSTQPPNSWGNHQQRRYSTTSSSVHSDDLENMKWPAFDGQSGFDDSGVVLDDEEDEERDQFPVAGGDDDMDNDQWLDGQSDGDDDGDNASAALSRRAEIILANAKKRLNVMEGNLRGARQSLVVSPTLNSTKMSTELSHQLAAARERDRKLYAGMGPIPPRTRHYHSSPLSSSNSPGHLRNQSETAVPLPFTPSYMSKVPVTRASSALGIASGPWSPEGHGHGRFPIRESRSVEVMREPQGSDEPEVSLRSHSRGSRSPQSTLETLPEEDGTPGLHRPSSMTIDLRDQMNELKGRISSLKLRAKEDSVRRQSLQSLRTPSPFTSAETWYSDADAYKNGGSPVSADAGVGVKLESPVRKALYEEERSFPSTPNITHLDPALGHTQDETGINDVTEQLEPGSTQHYPIEHYDDRHLSDPVELEVDIQGQDLDDIDDIDFFSVQNDDVEPAGSSVYEDAVYEMPVTERHEDRLDAFDYENFFLHSAMGTYSSTSRRSSSGSGDSVATTRPVTAILSPPVPTKSAKRISLHQRNSSVDSVSTMASFATAAEEQSDDEENEQMDQFSQQLLSNQPSHHATQSSLTSLRSDSAINMSKPLSSPTQTSTSRESSPASGLMTGLQTSKIFSVLLESPTQEQHPQLALSEEEMQLIYSLAASFRQVCANLQNTTADQYERKEWRRRLDDARRLLEGDVPEGRLF